MTQPQTNEPKTDEPKRETKIASVEKLLRRKNGATLEQIVKATGWQPHTARAAMTGLRKKGHAIEREKRGGASYWRIAKEAQA